MDLEGRQIVTGVLVVGRVVLAATLGATIFGINTPTVYASYHPDQYHIWR